MALQLLQLPLTCANTPTQRVLANWAYSILNGNTETPHRESLASTT